MAKKKNFLQGVGNIATNYGLALGDTALSTFGATDVIKDKHYKGTTGDEFAKVGNVLGTITKTAAPVVAGALGTTVGIPPSVSMAAVTGLQQGIGGTINKNELAKIEQDEQNKIARENQAAAFMNEPLKTNALGSYVTYEKGGKPKDIVVNIEKDELEVDQKTGEIINDFKNKPKHPKEKDIINLKGNVKVDTKNVIIPAKYRTKYIGGDKNIRRQIIHEILESQSKRDGSLNKMEDGGLPYIENKINLLENQDTSSKPPSLNQATGVNSKSSGLSNINSGTIAGAASTLPALGYGIAQTVQSKKALKELGKKPMARYSLGEQQAQLAKAQELEQAAKGRARMGFTPEEKAAYEQSLARQNQTMMSNAAKIGGAQGSKVLGALGQQNQTNALLDFAAKNAQMQRQAQQQADIASRYTNQTLGQLAAQRNLQTGVDINNRLRQEQALGTALSQGRQNVTNATSQLAGYGAMGAAQAMGAAAPVQKTPNAEELYKLLSTIK